ncbi:hypothetical protein [Kineobactrum salinum]|uniref:RiboL-PSP-HEPN domain-containing protein n=1 Tax=Kineobactrum salinum TaxID=2708301 RepID=A0A6C0U6S5_9GAMM|nr:hypothetical protein [Kineobactrum salinum]QIB65154.1 hypothetical protein G3T16_06790 [Kineobactrum salinum]
MDQKRVTAFHTLSWSIYDSWSELLAGTRFLLDILENDSCDEIAKRNLLRLVVVSSSQMAEVMLFTQLEKIVNSHPDSVKRLFDYELRKRISFSEARTKWPEILTGRTFNFGCEPMQSMELLYKCRNDAIHHTAKCPSENIGESAFYTAIESSKCIYNHFNPDNWNDCEYRTFVDNNLPKTKSLLKQVLGG